MMTSLILSLSLCFFADLRRVEDLGFAGLVALVSSEILGLESCCDESYFFIPLSSLVVSLFIGFYQPSLFVS